MSTDETINDLKLRMAAGIVNNEVTQNLELFEICIHLVPVSTYARIKLLALNIAKEIHHLNTSHKAKLLALEQCNEYMLKILTDMKDVPHE